MPQIPHLALGCALAALLALQACSAPVPPAQRAANTLAYSGSGDAAKGAIAFEESCHKCHNLKRGANDKGPQLLGVYGSLSGSLSDYNQRYSSVFKNGVLWNAEQLDRVIANPKQAFAGNKMRFDGLADANQRQDIIAYLATLKP